MKKQCVLLTALVLACGVPASFSTGSSVGFTAMAQSNGKVSGVVKDADGEPLIGVTVRVKGTQRGTVTDINGNYSIQASKNQTLVFSYVGFKATEVSAANAANVVMNNDGLKLDEVVITGEFGMKRVARAVGSSAQNVKAVDITESGRTDFISALQGRVSGMTVTSSGGAPGASTSVVLRSATSLSGNNQPLYVVDGVPMNNSSFNATSILAGGEDFTGLNVRSTDYSSRGNDFNPEDIESMTVLKGAAAAALYGSDASNGAIIITTKKGRNGKARVTYSNQLSWSKAYGWPKIQQKYANGVYGTTNYYYTEQNGAEYDGSIPTYDNAAALLQTGFMHKHNLSVEAGNEKMSVRASASFFDQTGVIKTTDLKRTNLSLAGKAEVAKWLKFEGSIQYVNQKNHKALRGLNGPIRQAYKWPQVDDMSNYMAADGAHMRYPNYYTDTDLLNPLFGLYKNLNYDVTDRFISAFSVNIVPFEHTFVRAQFGWDVSTSAYEYGSHPYYK
ncbi:MAG: SusC/RagA family TonB-linked outer membrane protein, partial [Sodaliphilus sp.]|nr:SusC/RagA family TonB-linked outer membrane protein [Sodaliphilus sp.]